MKIHGLSCLALVLAPAAAFALESTTATGADRAQMDLANINLNMEGKLQAIVAVLDAMNKCSGARKFYRPDDAEADANGCVVPPIAGIQIGRVVAPDADRWENQAAHVKFNQPFDNVPTVYINSDNFGYDGPCRGDGFTYKLTPHRITKTGFSVILPGHYGGCGGQHTSAGNWIAVDSSLVQIGQQVSLTEILIDPGHDSPRME